MSNPAGPKTWENAKRNHLASTTLAAGAQRNTWRTRVEFSYPPSRYGLLRHKSHVASAAFISNYSIHVTRRAEHAIPSPKALATHAHLFVVVGSLCWVDEHFKRVAVVDFLVL